MEERGEDTLLHAPGGPLWSRLGVGYTGHEALQFWVVSSTRKLGLW